MAAHRGEIRYSVVIPVFNEEAVLPILLRRLDTLMDGLDGDDLRR
jgi:polyisoprenyl-phosphate glycosyltransferase